MERQVVEFCRSTCMQNIMDLQDISDDEGTPLGLRVAIKQALIERGIGKVKEYGFELNDAPAVIVINSIDAGL